MLPHSARAPAAKPLHFSKDQTDLRCGTIADPSISPNRGILIRSGNGGVSYPIREWKMRYGIEPMLLLCRKRTSRRHPFRWDNGIALQEVAGETQDRR